MVFGLMIRFTSKPIYRMLVKAKPFFGTRNSKIWHGMPAGGYVAGSQPILGAVLLTSLIVLVMVAVGKPINLLALTPMDLNLGGVVISLAATLFLLISASSLMFVDDSKEEA